MAFSFARGRRWWAACGYALPTALVLVGSYRFWNFIQDDAYISLRYSAQLVAGHGLVFNPGERVEGFTNLAWTLLGAGALALHLPALLVLQALGVLSAVAAAVLTALAAKRLFGRIAGVAAGCLVASSSILHCWAASGLEMSFFAALIGGAMLAFAYERRRWAFAVLGLAAWTRPEAALVAVALAYTSGTSLLARRNEVATRSSWVALGRDALFFVVPALTLVGFRLVYYGAWTPNTYLVKAGGGAASHLLGLHRLAELALFNDNVALWLLAALGACGWACGWLSCEREPAALDSAPSELRAPSASRLRRWLGCTLRFAPGMVLAIATDVVLRGPIFADDRASLPWSAWLHERDGAWGWLALSALLGGTATLVLSWWPRTASHRARVLHFVALAWLGYVYYFVRVGGDFLPMHRLFLPALPLQALLAAGAVATLWRTASDRWAPRLHLGPLQTGRVQGALLTATAALGLWVCAEGVGFSVAQLHFATRASLARAHGRAGRDLQAIAAQHHFRPRVLAQDMGLLTFSSPGVDYVDAIGLTSRRVATILHRHHYSPYTRYLVWRSTPRRQEIEAMEAELRALFSSELAPDYAVIAADITGHPPAVAGRAAATGDGAYFRRFVEDNVFFYGWPRTRYFQEHYVFARAYPFSSTLYMVTYRRKDRPWLEPRPSR